MIVSGAAVFERQNPLTISIGTAYGMFFGPDRRLLSGRESPLPLTSKVPINPRRRFSAAANALNLLPLSGRSGHSRTCRWLDPVAFDPEETLWCHRLPFNSAAISVASTSSFGAQEPWNRSVPTHVRHAGRPCCKRLLRAHDRCGHGVVREQPLSCRLPRRRHSFLLPGGPSVSGIGGWAT